MQGIIIYLAVLCLCVHATPYGRHSRRRYESDLDYLPVCRPDEFTCVSGTQCVPKSWACDGVPDCHDRSDERHCSAVMPNTNQRNEGTLWARQLRLPNYGGCPDSWYTCSHGRYCIHPVDVCNGVDDCGDWDDEQPWCRDYPHVPNLATSPPPPSTTAKGRRGGGHR